MMIKYIYRYALFFILNRRCGISLLGVVLFFSCFFFPGGCGYSAKSLLRSNVRSIYIPIFDNDTFRRGYEFDLTREVRDQILMKTDLRIVERSQK